MQRSLFSDRTLWGYALLSLFLFAGLLLSRHHALSDFAGYYFGSRELMQGAYHRVYDMEAFNLMIAAEGYKGVYGAYAPFPPFTALVFYPFTFAGIYTAKLLFDGFSAVLFLFSLYRAGSFFALPHYVPLLIPVLFFVPVCNNLFFGQAYLLLFSLLLEGYRAFQQQKLVRSAALWALAILFKLFPAVIFCFLLLRRQYRAFVYLGLACAVLLLMSVSLTGLEVWSFYWKNVLPKLNAGELNHPFATGFQSAFVLLRKLFVPDPLLNPSPFYANPYWFGMTVAAFRTLILAACIALTLPKQVNEFLVWTCWIVASLLISPNGSTYVLVLLLLPLLAFLADRPQPGRPSLALLLLLILLACNLPVRWFVHLPVLLQFPRLYLLLVLFIVLVYHARKAQYHLAALLCAALLFFPSAWAKVSVTRNEQDESRYFLREETQLFIYDYTVTQNRLVCTAWTEQGGITFVAADGIFPAARQDAALVRNQVFLRGRQLTFSPDLKKKPMQLQDGTILYLSDKNRGIGFYTIRQLKIK